jgi:hypothetical protein
MRRFVLAIAIVLVLSFSATAAATPNVKVTLVVSAIGICDTDMPCDPPLGSYVVVFSRTGAVPVRIRMTGPGTTRITLRPGLYVTTVKSLRSRLVRRTGDVRVRARGVSTFVLAAPS